MLSPSGLDAFGDALARENIFLSLGQDTTPSHMLTLNRNTGGGFAVAFLPACKAAAHLLNQSRRAKLHLLFYEVGFSCDENSCLALGHRLVHIANAAGLKPKWGGVLTCPWNNAAFHNSIRITISPEDLEHGPRGTDFKAFMALVAAGKICSRGAFYG